MAYFWLVAPVIDLRPLAPGGAENPLASRGRWSTGTDRPRGSRSFVRRLGEAQLLSDSAAGAFSNTRSRWVDASLSLKLGVSATSRANVARAHIIHRRLIAYGDGLSSFYVVHGAWRTYQRPARTMLEDIVSGVGELRFSSGKSEVSFTRLSGHLLKEYERGIVGPSAGGAGVSVVRPLLIVQASTTTLSNGRSLSSAWPRVHGLGVDYEARDGIDLVALVGHRINARPDVVNSVMRLHVDRLAVREIAAQRASSLNYAELRRPLMKRAAFLAHLGESAPELYKILGREHPEDLEDLASLSEEVDAQLASVVLNVRSMLNVLPGGRVNMEESYNFKNIKGSNINIKSTVVSGVSGADVLEELKKLQEVAVKAGVESELVQLRSALEDGKPKKAKRLWPALRDALSASGAAASVLRLVSDFVAGV